MHATAFNTLLQCGDAIADRSSGVVMGAQTPPPPWRGRHSAAAPPAVPGPAPAAARAGRDGPAMHRSLQFVWPVSAEPATLVVPQRQAASAVLAYVLRLW
jgi:hypothetical protein